MDSWGLVLAVGLVDLATIIASIRRMKVAYVGDILVNQTLSLWEWVATGRVREKGWPSSYPSPLPEGEGVMKWKSPDIGGTDLGE